MVIHHSPLAQDTQRLDRPVWSALASGQGRWAVRAGHVRAFRPDIGQFAATAPGHALVAGDLQTLLPGRPTGLTFLQADDVACPDGLVTQRARMGVQMLLDQVPRGPFAIAAEPLSPADVAAMRALVAMTEPGPFWDRTILLGAYWGIRARGQLIAMAGERMRMPGFTEISAVCVHPDHRGQGLARKVVRQAAMAIMARGDIPFLHTFADNLPAIALYESLGFKLRRHMHIVTLAAA